MPENKYSLDDYKTFNQAWLEARKSLLLQNAIDTNTSKYAVKSQMRRLNNIDHNNYTYGGFWVQPDIKGYATLAA